jgi:hypothetical protein
VGASRHVLARPVKSSHPVKRWVIFFVGLGGVFARACDEAPSMSNVWQQSFTDIQRCALLYEHNKIRETAAIEDRSFSAAFRKGIDSFCQVDRFALKRWRHRAPTFMSILARTGPRIGLDIAN